MGRQPACRLRALDEVFPHALDGTLVLRVSRTVCHRPVDNDPGHILYPGRVCRNDPYPCHDHRGRGLSGRRVWKSGVGPRGSGRDL